MPSYLVCPVRRFERFDFLVRQRQIEGGEGGVEVGEFGDADDGSRDGGVGEEPGQGHGGRRCASALGHLLERGEDRLRIAAPNRFAAQRLSSRRDALADACQALFGRAMSVEIDAPPDPVASGAPAGGGSEQLRQLRQQALNHPGVSMTVEILEGEIAEIRPVGDSR